MCLGWRQKPPPSPRPQLQQEDLSTADAVQPNNPTASRYQYTPTSGSPQQTECEQLLPVAAGLPSQVDETLEACPRFRILLAGKSGIGKSSLIKCIFNLDPDKVDIAHRSAGMANIYRAYTSPANPRFILHDSNGFESGSDGNWTTVEAFLDNSRKLDLPERIHALCRFCIETPLDGSRLLQRGDEKLLKLAERFKIPIIVVFLKYDGLVAQFFVNDKAKSWTDNYVDAKKKASESFDCIVNELKKELLSESIPCVKVSTPKFSEKDPGPLRSLDPADITELLMNLAKVTRERLQDVEVKLRSLWDAAQQVNARLKAEASISEGFKKYWLDLGRSSAFEGQLLIDCIHRLHDDVVKVWNFNDPTKILSSIDFFIRMIGLVKPLIEARVDPTLSSPLYVLNFGSSGAKLLVPLLQDIGLNNSHVNYLYDKYQRYPSTAKLLSTYIINFILVLYGIFSDILPSDPPRSLSYEVVFKVLIHHKDALETNTLDDIDSDPEFATHPEKVIANVIRERLPKDSERLEV